MENFQLRSWLVKSRQWLLRNMNFTVQDGPKGWHFLHFMQHQGSQERLKKWKLFPMKKHLRVRSLNWTFDAKIQARSFEKDWVSKKFSFTFTFSAQSVVQDSETQNYIGYFPFEKLSQVNSCRLRPWWKSLTVWLSGKLVLIFRQNQKKLG